MTRLTRAQRLGLAVGLGAITLGWVALATRRGETAEPQLPATPPSLYTGSLACISCHNVTAASPLNPYTASLGFVKLNEYDTWRNQDKHSLAYQNLSDSRGRQIGERLHVDVTKPEAGCLGCHSAGQAELNQRVLGNLFRRDEGVSCENCHGPSSNWGGNTHALGGLRLLPTEARTKLGMVDLRTAEHQSGQCLSCHVGNVAEQKVITHAMYAAGHPPLPSIEVASFSDVIPRHWYLPSERVDPAIRAQQKTLPGQTDRTKLAVVGAAAALRTALNLLADEAGKTGSTEAPAPGQTWPDYARFDCQSCHHDLQRDGWRQARGFEGTPGRPPLNEWPLAMVELGIDRLTFDDPSAGALRTDLQRFRQSLAEPTQVRPFGRGTLVSKSARDFAAWCDLLVSRLEAATYDTAVTQKLLRRLVDRAASAAPDYDEARDIGWGIAVLIRDLGSNLSRKDEVDAVMARLRDLLELDLPAGRDRAIEANLPRALARAADYNPAQFRDQVTALAGLLPPG